MRGRGDRRVRLTLRASGNGKSPRQIEQFTRELFPSAATVVRAEVDRLMAIVSAAVPAMIERRREQALARWAAADAQRDETAVVYTKAHLRTLGARATSPLWRKLGRIVGRDGRWTLVLWDGAEQPVPVAPGALCNPLDSAAADCELMPGRMHGDSPKRPKGAAR